MGLPTSGRVVFITFCCESVLKFSDPRLKNRVFISTTATYKMPEIVFLNKGLPVPANASICNGIHFIANMLETKEFDKLYVFTSKRKEKFSSSLFLLQDLSKAYDVICKKDNSTIALDDSFGTEEQWEYALNLFDRYTRWEEVITSEFGSFKNLEFTMPSYKNFDENKQWLYFIGLKLYGSSTNLYLNMASKLASSKEDLIHQLFRTILSVSYTDSNFSKLYGERKSILDNFKERHNEVIDYCKMAKSKQIQEIFYLTDLTQLEKEQVFAFLDKYGDEYERKTLENILSVVYPDLYLYLSPYHFKNDFVNSYFQQYKYQKVINKVFPEFEKIVEEQSVKRDFTLLFEPRTSKFEDIDKNESQLYFIDALGVEYLGYIMSKCHQKGLEARVTVCYSELPSLTCFNKEFVQTYEDLGLQVISIKDIDEIKHGGKSDFDYRQTHLPIHLSSELQIIDDTLEKIQAKLFSEVCHKIVIVADHGATRLAVISEKENQWEMSSKGEHSGRCCPKTDIETKPKCSTEERNYWILANYDRFKGGRKSNVEVHGGATLEEIIVPIIEITKKSSDIEIYIVDTVITMSFRKKPSITLFSKTKLNNVSVCVDGTYYDAVQQDDNFYIVEMLQIKKKGDYTADVYSNGNLLVSDLEFTVKKEGSQENKLF